MKKLSPQQLGGLHSGLTRPKAAAIHLNAVQGDPGYRWRKETNLARSLFVNSDGTYYIVHDKADMASSPPAKGFVKNRKWATRVSAIEGTVEKVAYLAVHDTKSPKFPKRPVTGMVQRAKREDQIAEEYKGSPHIISPSLDSIEFEKAGARRLALMRRPAVTAEDVFKDPAVKSDVKLKIIIDASDGLSQIHSRESVHRDFKPENILVEGDPHGPASQVTGKLCDLDTVVPNQELVQVLWRLTNIFPNKLSKSSVPSPGLPTATPWARPSRRIYCLAHTSPVRSVVCLESWLFT